MKTKKVIGNIMLSKDLYSVYIINTVTMKKINQKDLPYENSYLYSAYKDEQTKTLFLTFDTK